MKHVVSGIARAALAALALIACASWTSPSPSPAAGSDAAELVPSRPPGDSMLRLAVTSDEGRGPRRLEALFELHTDGGGRERAALVSCALGPPDAPGEAVQVSDACRQAFGGDATRVGAFDVASGDDLSALVPACVPEPIFGAATDLLAFLQVQQGAVECDGLRVAGDACERPGFTVTWSRPGVAAARISTSKVTLTVVESGPDAFVLHWRPDPLELSILRTDTPGGAVLVHGVETLALEVRLARDGRLLSGRSLVDTVDFTARPTSARELPAPGEPPPSGPSFSGRFERDLQLEAVSGPP